MKVEAHSPEWYQARIGVFTASRLYELLNTPKDTPRPYIIEKATEKLTGLPQEGDYVSDDMAHGVESEPLAINYYIKSKKRRVEEDSVFQMHTSLNFGATTDRNVYDTENNLIIAEIKCPATKTHIKNCLIKDVAQFKKKRPKYYWQIVGGAIVHGATKGAFVSFDQRVDMNYALYVLEFDIPTEDLKAAEAAIIKAEKEMAEIIETISPSTNKTEAA